MTTGWRRWLWATALWAAAVTIGCGGGSMKEAASPGGAPPAEAVSEARTVSADSGGDLEQDEAERGPAPPPPPSPASTPPRQFAGVPGVQATGSTGAVPAKESADFRSFQKKADDGGKLAQNVPTPKPAPGQPPTGKKAPESASDVAYAVQSPMLVYTANITMAVFEVKKALGDVELIGREVGGFLSRRDNASITIRVPVARFDEALKRVDGLGDVLDRNVSTQDVTEEFNDLDVRLKSARAVRDRLEQLLQKAAKVEESVLIERELQRVGLEIERIEGRMKFLKDRASFSTITVTFRPRRNEATPNKFNLPVPWLYELGLSRLLSL